MKKQQVFYIHGGESFENHEDYLERLKTVDLWHLPSKDSFSTKKWTGSLAEDLGEGYEVLVPPMPNKQNAKFQEWKIWFERHFEYLNDGAILIGCSLGAMFLAKYLSKFELPFKPEAVLLMAGAYKLPYFDDKDCGDFLVTPEDVAEGIDKELKVVIVHSRDDFLVPYEHATALSEALEGSELMTFEDKNHFLVEEFPELLDKIRKVSNQP
jgi:predicted alpha/beta hydrolase family esterase